MELDPHLNTEEEEEAPPLNTTTLFHHFSFLLIFAILYSASFVLSDYLLVLVPRHLLLFPHPPLIFILLNITITFIVIFSAPKSQDNQPLHHHLHDIVPTPTHFTTITYNHAAADQESKVTDHHEVVKTTTVLIEPNEAKEETPSELMEETPSEQTAMASQINPMDKLSSEEFREMIEKFIAKNKKILLSELMADHRETYTSI